MKFVWYWRINGEKCNLVSKNILFYYNLIFQVEGDLLRIDCIWFVDVMNIFYKQVEENNANYF